MKKIIPKFEGDIVDGKLKLLPHVKQSIARWLLTFKTGTHIEITIKKYKSQRSIEQNSYYWGVVIPILANHFGYDHDEIHEELKLMFNPIQSKIDPSRKIGGSTTKMSTEEFYCDQDSYVEKICRWAATEYGVFIPPPQKKEDNNANTQA